MTNQKLVKGTLAFALASTLLLSACSTDEDKGAKDFPADKPTTQSAEPVADPADVTSPEAKAELQEACDKLTDDEVALILGVDTAATAWTIDESMGEASEYDMGTGEYAPTGKPQCVWTVTTEDASAVERNLSITLRGPADASTLEGSGAVVVPNAGTGTYESDDDATLFISPAGSSYEYTFAADFPQEGTPYQVQSGLRIATAQAAFEAFN